MKILMSMKFLAVSLLFVYSLTLRSEPWVDTRDAFLRADIELLADIGLIRVPITTYPLMWSGIVKDLDSSDISDVPGYYKPVYWRVKKAAKYAYSQQSMRELRLSAASSPSVLRSYGEVSRGKAELAARGARVTKNFAWNLEVTRLKDPFDNDKTRYDGSYLGGILGNWMIAAGAIEKWWGPGWDSSNLLSNNARPPLGFSLQRNYSDELDVPLLNWLGPWTLTAFAAELDDERAVNNANLAGLSFSFKPHYSIELAIRATALWGGDNRSDSFDRLFDAIVGGQTCGEEEPQGPITGEVDCDGSIDRAGESINLSSTNVYADEFFSDSGDRKAGLDLRWKLPFDVPISFYASAYGEDETEVLPGKTIKQFGFTSTFNALDTNWKWFIEQSDTTLDGAIVNTAYENQVYQSGYRYFRRSIGSTYDNDSKITSFGILGEIDKRNKFKLKISTIRLNEDGSNVDFSDPNSPDAQRFGGHSLSAEAQDFQRVKFDWIHRTKKSGDVEVTVDWYSEQFDQYERIDDEINVAVGWKYYLF